MLNDIEQSAIHQWYSQDHVANEAARLAKDGAYEKLEELLHRRALLPLGRHSELPAFMLDSQGQPLFPSNIDPREDEELWQAAIEIGWQVVLEQTGLSRDRVHRTIATRQEQDWQAFLASVETRKSERA